MGGYTTNGKEWAVNGRNWQADEPGAIGREFVGGFGIVEAIKLIDGWVHNAWERVGHVLWETLVIPQLSPTSRPVFQ